MAGNQYKEQWTLEEATKFMEEAVKLSRGKEFDFIGEVAKKQESYHHIYSYLVEKFTDLKPLFDELKSNCEANCFFNGKKGDIVPSMAIMNLKSNHGWTDRVDTTTKDKEINNNTVDISKLSDAALRELANASRDTK
jgi:hypothetical protein